MLSIVTISETRTGQPILDLFDKSIIPPKTEKTE